MEDPIFSIEIIKNNNIEKDKLLDHGYHHLYEKIYYSYNVKPDSRLNTIFDQKMIHSSIFLIIGKLKWSYIGWAYQDLMEVNLSFEAGLYYLVSEYKLHNLEPEIRLNIFDILYKTEINTSLNPENIRLVI